MLQDLELVVKRASAEPLKFSRRTLMASAGFLALATSVSVGPTSRAFANTGISASQRLTLIRMARDIYPHDDFLPDEPYVAVVDSILKEAESDTSVRKMVRDGLADLESRAQAIHKTNYTGVSDANKREALLRSIELTGFFQKFRGGLLMGIYNNKSLWPKFGYDGSSWENGGFVDTFDKIDWL